MPTPRGDKNLDGVYLPDVGEPNPCAMPVIRNDVQHASIFNRINWAIEILCGRVTAAEATIIELEEGGGGDGCPDYCGNGSPEGVVTAVVGSEYMQWDAAALDHSRWTKFSNAGNTGWRRWSGLAGAAGGSGTGYRIGDGSVATGENSLAFGEDEDASNVCTISMGFGNTIEAEAPDAHPFREGIPSIIAIGHRNSLVNDTLSLDGSIVIGSDNDVSQAGLGVVPTIVVGTENLIDGDDNQVLGSQIVAENNTHDAVIIGFDMYLTQVSCAVVIGHGAEAGPGSGITAVGAHTEALQGGTAIGFGAEATGATSPVALGNAARAYGPASIALGTFSLASGDDSIALGYFAEASGDSSIALGKDAEASVANTMRIGSAAYPIDLIEVYTSGGLVQLFP